MTLLQLPNSDKIALINQMHEETKLPQVIIEKDLWVTAVLRALFTLPYAVNLSFKGGTSLSKCWNLIERFSEDIDIAINREYFGFFGDTFTVKQISKNLRKSTCTFVRNTLQFDLATQMKADGIPVNLFSVAMNITPVSTVDPERVYVEYKSVFNLSPYIKNTVIVEIGGRSMKEPIQKVAIQSLMDKHFSQATFAEPPFEISVVAPERTFWEKVCLLHEEFSKPQEQIRVERMSRHLYDLAKMFDTEFADNALKNNDLFQSIIAHRRMFISLKDFDYETLSPKTIKITPPDNAMSKWEDDYNSMQTMIYGYPLSFAEIMNKIRGLNDKINRLE